MSIIFKKIPKLALVFYTIGFIILMATLAVYFYIPSMVSVILLQQAFIGGAIIVAIGSIINTIFQFKPTTKNNIKKE